jgi:hypothetical protein
MLVILAIWGAWDWEDLSLRAAWVKSLQDSISKITRPKWTGGAVQVIEHLLWACKALSSNPSYIKNNEKKNPMYFFGHLFHLCPYSSPLLSSRVCYTRKAIPAIDRPGAGDVTHIAWRLTASVQKHHFTILEQRKERLKWVISWL